MPKLYFFIYICRKININFKKKVMSEKVEYKEIGEHQILGFYNDELFCDCTYESEYNLSIVSWVGCIPEILIISAYVNIGIFAKQNNWRVIRNIVNLSQLEGSFDETNEWLMENYMPKLIERGFKCSAIVQSQDLYAQLATGETLELAENLFTTQIFQSYQEAYHWIVMQ